jgi:phenylglyoxylate dehydrogenase beta subunit
MSRIRIRSTVIEWLMGEGESSSTHPFERVICRQCHGISPCIAVCPVEGALSRDLELGMITWNDEMCIRCFKCVESCPYKAIWYSENTDKILKCELCGGEPACVQACPPRILEFVYE